MDNNQNQQANQQINQQVQSQGNPQMQQQYYGPTKICKHCRNIIPKKAKICPQCRKNQGGIVKWVIIAIVAICIIGAAAGGNKKNKPSKVGDSTSKKENTDNTESSGTENDDEEAIFRKGETAELNDVQVTLTNYEENAGSDFNKPEEGKVFLMAEFEITNNSKKDLAISSVMSFDAYADDYSLDFSLSALISKEGSQLDGTVAPGKKMKGWIGWEVPADYKNVEIHFTDNVWSNDKFVFLIEK